MNTRNEKRRHRTRRIRARVVGTAIKPRLSIFRSLTSFSAQMIDDTTGKTLASASLHEVKGSKNTVEGVASLGEVLAKKAKSAGITEVVFDRSGYKYHGKVRAFAESAREGGLHF